MSKAEKKLLVEKFKNKACSQEELLLLRNMSEADDAIRQLLDLGNGIQNTDAMMSEKELLKELKKLHKKSIKSGRRARLLGDE